jgi:hypothetical protein
MIVKNIRMIEMAVLAFVLLVLAFPGQTKADERDQATLFHFASAVRVPGQVLPAGSYWFALADHGAYRKTVQILRAEDMALVATIETAWVERAEPTGATEITFAEPGSDSRRSVPAITEWFYPGDDVGHEFIYSTRREKQIEREREQELKVGVAREAGAAGSIVAVP